LAIGRAFPGELLDPERGADASQFVNLVLGIGKSALLHQRALLSAPSTARAVERFPSIFDGVIDTNGYFAGGADGVA
jgi:hypothetical protein